jgi:YqaJ-like recombinase protein
MSQPIFFKTKADWLDARRGLFTASSNHKLCTNGKRDMTEEELKDRPKTGTGSKTTTIEDENILSEGALSYIRELVTDLNLTKPRNPLSAFDIQWGLEYEPYAVALFAEKFGFDLNSPDFIYSGENDPVFFLSDDKKSGGTPDVILLHALAEVKCPNVDTHMKYLLMDNEQDLKDAHFDYWVQMQDNMRLADKPMCYFISYHPHYIERLQLKVIIIRADEIFQNYLQRRITLGDTAKLRLIEQVNLIK